MTNLGETWDSL